MGAGDNLQPAYPNNSFRQDWAFYPFVGGRGAAGLVHTGVTRYSFWVDLDPFDVVTTSVNTENVSFQIFSDSLGTLPLQPYIVIDTTNDFPDALAQATVSGLTAGSVVKMGSASVTLSAFQPPYFLKAVSTPQTTKARSAFYDQGTWTYGTIVNGFSYGANRQLAQGFVPTQAQLTAFHIGLFFQTGGTDHTTYQDTHIELWDSNHNFLQHLATLQPTYTATSGSSGITGDVSIAANVLSTLVADDGITYWTEMSDVQFLLNSPISLTPGSTYYLVLRTATQAAQRWYAVADNMNLVNVRNEQQVYPFANAFSAADGSSTWTQLNDNNGLPISLPFITVGAQARIAVTFWWPNVANGANNFWFGTPNSNEFSFLRLNYNQRI